MPEHSPLPSDLDTRIDLLQSIETLASREPALSGARLHDALRVVPGKRAIIEGEFDGRPAIFRFYIENAEEYATRDWNELVRTQGYMSDGDLRVNAPLHHIPGLGLVVMERIEGTRLMKHIWRSDRDARADYLIPAANWLRKYTAPTETRVPARPNPWLTRARNAIAQQPYKRLRPVEAAIMAEIERIARTRRDSQWRMAICHGDFHPNNLLVNGPRVTGIDTGGSAKLPIYKDMARFLTHMGRRRLTPSGERRFGVDRVGLDAFARAFALDETERGIWLPFMIGVEALIRVESRSLSSARVRKAKAFYEEALEDLRGIAV